MYDFSLTGTCITFQFNWYTKRGSLAGIYKATEIYMLQDKSEDYTDTWSFLDSRLQDISQFGKVVKNVSQQYTSCKTLNCLQNFISACYEFNHLRL